MTPFMELEPNVFYPTLESWNDGDRLIQCAASSKDTGAKTRGSAKAAEAQ